MIKLLKEFLYDYERCASKKARYLCVQNFFRVSGDLAKAKQKIDDDYLHYVRTTGDVK